MDLGPGAEQQSASSSSSTQYILLAYTLHFRQLHGSNSSPNPHAASVEGRFSQGSTDAFALSLPVKIAQQAAQATVTTSILWAID